MKKFINYNYRYKSTNSERVRLIKEAGFDGVFIYSQYRPVDYITEIINAGLEIETLHLPYKLIKNGRCIDSRYVNTIWTDNLDSDAYVSNIIQEIEFANFYNIKNVVMHVTGGNTPPPISMRGVNKIIKILECCEKKGIKLCLENLRRLDYLKFLFDNIDSEQLRFCFDSGHANYMTKNIQDFPWDMFGNKLCCLHLNDNYADSDSHSIPFMGNIEWLPLLNKIMMFNNNLNLTLEVRAKDDEIDNIEESEYLKKCFDSLLKIESLKR